jgi:hypothetical protein
MPFLTSSPNSGGIEPSAYLHKQLDTTGGQGGLVNERHIWYKCQKAGGPW